MTGEALSGKESSVEPTAIDWAQLGLRGFISILIVGIFIWINYSVMDLIVVLANQDTSFIGAKTIPPNDRLINANVIMSLIAGTVAQVVTVLLGITRFLFPTS